MTTKANSEFYGKTYLYKTKHGMQEVGVLRTPAADGRWMVGWFENGGQARFEVKDDRLGTMEQAGVLQEKLEAWAEKRNLKPAVEAVTAVVVKKTAEELSKTDEVAEKVLALHNQAKTYASAAVYCAAAAGALMLQKKSATEHGQFIPWLEGVAEELGVHVRTCRNYMNMAAQMVERIKAMPKGKRVSFLPETANQEELPAESTLMILAKFDPAKAKDLAIESVKALVREVTGEQSLRQLYFDWEIVKSSKKERLGSPDELIPPSNLALEAETDWKELCRTLYQLGIAKPTWQDLTHKSLIEYHGIITLISKRMGEAVKLITTKK